MRIHLGREIQEILLCDLWLEMQVLPVLREAIAVCEKLGDYVSRQLYHDILHREKAHVDWFDMQLELLEKIGLENYVQAQIG